MKRVPDVQSTVPDSYVWGQDLSGSLQNAGGIGGLLSATFNSTSTVFYTFDGNGNVTDLTAQNGSIVASYQHDPFGKLISITGDAGILAANNYLFSTKYQDRETGLLYYGYRYLSPELGRWLSRDPIGERYGATLYVMCHNNMVTHNDPFGLLERDELFGWSETKRLEWMHAFREKFKEAIRKSSKANCVPRRLVAVIVANELAEWRWPDGTMFDGMGGGGIGPAQVALETAINEGVTGLEGSGIYNEAMLIDAADAKLRTIDGSIDITTRLMRKYLVELCDRAKTANFGVGLLKSSIYGDCNVDRLCCSGLIMDCPKLQEYVPSRCIIRMMAAVWNSNRGVLDAKDPISDESGKKNFPNALNNALWAEDFFRYMSDLVD